MPRKPNSKRPGPNAYDHLWPLLPVFIAFVAALVFIALTDPAPAPTTAGHAARAGVKS
jgi:hypothetical protein